MRYFNLRNIRYGMPVMLPLSQAEEWLEIVEQQFYPWAAQYLITERVSIEPNFHELYLQFVETLCQNEYANHVLTETYNNIKVSCFKRLPMLFICINSDEMCKSKVFLLSNLSALHGLAVFCSYIDAHVCN